MRAHKAPICPANDKELTNVNLLLLKLNHQHSHPLSFAVLSLPEGMERQITIYKRGLVNP